MSLSFLVGEIMPFLAMPHTRYLYYDYFLCDITTDIPSTSLVPTVLLLHGFLGTAESDFSTQLPRLRARFNVIAPHLHGFGRSSHRTAYTPAYYREDVEDMVALLDKLKIEHVLVQAFSDGAIVALLLAALYPQRVAALTTLGAQATLDGKDIAGLRYWLLERPLSQEWQEQLAQLHDEPYWRTLPALYIEVQEALLAQGGVLISDEELARIDCPTLIMHGMRDRVVPVAYAHAIHKRIAKSQLLLFDAGHAAHLRYEQEYGDAVLRFFACKFC
jgi:valacyclovir hydrolase